MHAESSITFSPVRSKGGILALSGYGIRVVVERGHLVIEDGRGNERRQARFPRTSRDLKRLVILGHSGSISFDALRWLHDRGCCFSQLDSDGIVLMASGPLGLDDASLRRAQALARDTGTGLEVAKELIRAKISGQAEVAERIGDFNAEAASIRELGSRIDDACDIGSLRVIEAQAAAIYWECWSGEPVRFARRVAERVPNHWHSFGARTSPLTGSPRVAANPSNAILNYLYAILESEARLALLAVGLDPGMGVMHADLRSRDSLACDVMEAVRPSVDGYLLDLLRSRVFGPGDCFETREGSCRLLPPVTKVLAESALSWAKLLAPVVEQVAQRLRADARSERVSGAMPTPLTQTNRKAARQRVRARTLIGAAASEPVLASAHIPATEPIATEPVAEGLPDTVKRRTKLAPAAASIRVPAVDLLPACHLCGVLLDSSGRSYCDDCTPEIQQEHGGDYARIGLDTLAQLRTQGIDPAHGGTAAARRAERLAANQAAIAAWEADAARSSAVGDERGGAYRDPE